MRKRWSFFVLVVAAVAVWWLSDHLLVPWVQRVTGYSHVRNRALSVLLGHWVIDQGARVLACLGVWLVGTRLGLMPSFTRTLGSGGSWPRVVRTGLIATVVFLIISSLLVVVSHGSFGFHPDLPKMAGDLVSNLYEEIVYRGLMFSAFYGVAAGEAFPLAGPTRRAGLVTGTIGSCVVFAMGHEQYPVALRVVVGLVAIVFAVPWFKSRSLWAPWIPHTLGDWIGDTFMKL